MNNHETRGLNVLKMDAQSALIFVRCTIFYEIALIENIPRDSLYASLAGKGLTLNAL